MFSWKKIRRIQIGWSNQPWHCSFLQKGLFLDLCLWKIFSIISRSRTISQNIKIFLTTKYQNILIQHNNFVLIQMYHLVFFRLYDFIRNDIILSKSEIESFCGIELNDDKIHFVFDVVDFHSRIKSSGIHSIIVCFVCNIIHVQVKMAFYREITYYMERKILTFADL